MKRILRYLADHALAATALVVGTLGLASGSYAALTISGGQIQNRSIPPTKFDPRFINGSTRAWAVVSPTGRLIAGAGHPRVSTVGLPGQFEIDWGVRVSRRCATEATVDNIASPPTETVSGTAFKAGYVTAATYSQRKVRRTVLETFNAAGQPTPLGFDVTVVC